MYYVNLYLFLEEPEKALIAFNKSQQNAPPRPSLFDEGGLSFEIALF